MDISVTTLYSVGDEIKIGNDVFTVEHLSFSVHHINGFPVESLITYGLSNGKYYLESNLPFNTSSNSDSDFQKSECSK